MVNSQLIGIEAKERQQRLLDTAQQVHRARHAHRAPRRRLRVRAGRLLVQAGVRLAFSGGAAATPPARRALVATRR